MRKHYIALVFFAGLGVCRAQVLGGNPFNAPFFYVDAPSADNAATQAPTADQTVSLARLRHRIPGKALAAFERALKFARRQEWQQGAKELETSVKLDPDFSDAHGNLGTYYLVLGRLNDAIMELHRAIALDSSVSLNHSNLALAYLMRRDRSEARMEAETAVALDSTNMKGQYLLGALLAQDTNEQTKAQKHLTFAAREIPEAHLVLRALYRQAGDDAMAAKELQQYKKAISKLGK